MTIITLSLSALKIKLEFFKTFSNLDPVKKYLSLGLNERLILESLCSIDID